MKTRTKLTTRVLSVLIVLTLCIGLIPMFATTASAADAATEVKELSKLNLTSYTDGVTQYFRHNNCIYKVVFSNLKDITQVKLGVIDGQIGVFRSSSNFSNLVTTANSTSLLYESSLSISEGSSISVYMHKYLVDSYCNDPSKPVATITCLTLNNPTWSWESNNASATAKFTSTDGAAMMTVKASITSSSTTGADCKTAGTVTYTAKATANGTAYTDVKTQPDRMVTIPAGMMPLAPLLKPALSAVKQTVIYWVTTGKTALAKAAKELAIPSVTTGKTALAKAAKELAIPSVTTGKTALA